MMHRPAAQPAWSTSPSAVRPLRVAVDIGGTFTDLVVEDAAAGRVRFVKVGSTPDAPARAVLEALARAEVPLDQVGLFAHGSTVATNALLTRRLAHTALITTEGFRDVHEIRRGDREELWDAYRDPPGPYVRRRHRLEVRERVGHDGAVITPLDLDAARAVARTVARRGYDSVAVCFVNAYAHAGHEQEMARLLADEAPSVHVSCSSEVAPVIFEHERTSTTVVTACLAPIVSRYLADLQASLRERGFKGDVLVLHSGGGVMTARAMARAAGRIAKSGPAAGAIAMAELARACGIEHAIGVDIGGTSSDVSIMTAGELGSAEETTVEFGYPIQFPSIEVLTVGAGGGSIAWIDDGGALRSGPDSAGAAPGPACYGRGGELPTTTDAQAVLGRLGEDSLLGDRIGVDVEAARAAIASHIAGPLGLDVTRAAAAILAVAEASVAEALRLVSIRRGLDPRDYALVAFGGAGPLMGAAVAADVGLREVIVPIRPGLTSALGGLLLDLRHDVTRSWIRDAEHVEVDELAGVLAALEEEAFELVLAEGATRSRVELVRALDLRYRGQWRSLTVPVAAPVAASLASTLARFHAEHERRYAYARPGAPVELHGVRVSAVGHMPRPDLFALAAGDEQTGGRRSRRPVIFGGRTWTSEVLDRAVLQPGEVYEGPLVVEQMDATALVPPGAVMRVDELHNLRIAPSAEEAR
jgi:N-methylhydantoinase A